MRIDPKYMLFQLLLAVILTVGSFCFFQFLYPYHLFLKEQLQLYLFTADYFLSYFEKPAWLACSAGDFLTQFFYLRGGGAMVLALLLLVEWGLTTQVLKRFGWGDFTPLFALFPVAAEWMLHTELSYPVAGTVSTLFLLMAFLLYASVRNKYVSMAVGLILAAGLYMLIGAVSLLFPLLVVLYEWLQNKTRWPYWMLLFTFGIIPPFFLRMYYLLSFQQLYHYPFTTVRQLLFPFVLMLLLVPSLFPEWRKQAVSAGGFALTVFALLAFLIGGLVMKGHYKREKTLSLVVETYFGNEERVNKRVKKGKLPATPLTTNYIDIALFKQGSLPDRLLEYYQPASTGLLLPVGPGSDWLTIFGSNEAFYQLGDMNMAQHSAMLGMTFSPKYRSSRMVKRLAEIQIINEDTTAARKYLRILNATLFHRRWAKERLVLLDGQVAEIPVWVSEKRALIPSRDTLYAGTDYVASLTQLLKSNPENSMAADYLLCFHLLNKDIPSFVAAYDMWYKAKASFVPRVYSEALLIALVGRKASEKELLSYKLPAEKISDFMAYTGIYEANEGNMEPLREAYGTTYWFYYHFAQLVQSR